MKTLSLISKSVAAWPPAASKWPEIIFDLRIEILALKKLYLDVHEDILEFDLHNCTWLASRISLQWYDIIFD